MRAMILLVALLAATPARSEVTVIDEFANLEVSAWSSCPEDEAPEPDTDKYFVETVIGTSPDLVAGMSSACGEAGVESHLSVTRTISSIGGSFGTSSFLEMHGGGVASLGTFIVLRVDTPTSFTLSAVGSTTETGESHFGSMEIALFGGMVDEASDGAEDFDFEWTGTFEPGTDYRLLMQATSTRAVRSLPGGQFIGMDGTTDQTISFTLDVGGEVVGEAATSMGCMKARF